MNRERQQGVALAVGLMLLLVITLVGVTAMRNVTLEEKMSQNQEDRTTAFNAAQAMLVRGVSDYFPNAFPSVDTGTALDPVARYNAGNFHSVWKESSQWNAAAVDFGSASIKTTPASVPLVATQPEMVVEYLGSEFNASGRLRTVENDNHPPELYRVTARGFGKTADARATVQSIVKLTN